ncbi:hypothetical protein AB0D35_08860 [Streptomyces sp. NPDC048301]|uniref:hypothetical protein n=1 Tax=unclassified Streptomyces TaxID=2593676 RepID=UPI00341FAB71
MPRTASPAELPDARAGRRAVVYEARGRPAALHAVASRVAPGRAARRTPGWW